MPLTGEHALEWTSGDARVVVDLVPIEVLGALARLRTRLLQSIDALPLGEAEHATRCDEWRAVDLVNHLADTTHWATEVIAAAAEHRASVIFEGFHVRATPKQLTDAAPRDLDAARARLHQAMEANLHQVAEVVGLQERPTMTPVGPQPFPVAALHVLWDTWLHERDLLLPLGVQVPEHEDETRLAAVYTLRLIGFALAMMGRELSVALRLHGATECLLRLDATRGRTSVRVVETVDGATPELSGDAATVVDALTGRGDLAAALDGPEELRRALSPLRRFLAGR